MLLLAPKPMRYRSINIVPALLVMMLNECGKLPPIPNTPKSGGLGFRLPTLKDMEEYKWVAEWEGRQADDYGFRTPAGLAAFKDHYDMHTSSDVREVVSIRGTPRSIVNLMRWMRDDAMPDNRRVIGSMNTGDDKLQALMIRLKGTPTRVLMEYAWAG